MRITLLYSPEDEAVKIKLIKHLIPLSIEIWDSSKILPGQNYSRTFEDKLNLSNYIIVLMTANLLSDENLTNRINEFHYKKQIKVIPVIVNYCLWELSSLRSIKVLPKNGIPILKNDGNQEARYHEVSVGIKDVITQIRNDEKKDYDFSKDIGYPRIPFVGLNWYKREHSKIFFGRENDLIELIEIIREDTFNLILLYGRSGVGKSSFLNAGLIPRIENKYEITYLRRHKFGNLIVALNEMTLTKGKSIIIIDQIEEIYTDPNKELTNEKELFASFLKKILKYSSDIKIILSFRKEYLAELHKLIENEDLDWVDYYLMPLKRENIFDAISGITKTKSLKRKYNIKIEEDLPYLFSGDLLKGEAYHIAPLMQIILFRMWNKVSSEKQKHFSVKLYESCKTESLEEYLDFQLNRISEKKNYALLVEKGFFLDVLDFFTTKLQTSKQRKLNDLYKSYHHILSNDEIENILQLLISLSLISIDSENKTYRLIHDALAPVVINKYNSSNLVGQVASRALKSAIDLKINLSKDSTLIALEGKNWRKRLNEIEKKTLDKSIKKHFINVARDQVSSNNLQDSINLIFEFSIQNKLYELTKHILLNSNRYNIIMQVIKMDICRFEEKVIIWNQLCHSMLSIINDIPIFEKENYELNVIKKIESEELKEAIEYLIEYCEIGDNEELMIEVKMQLSRILFQENQTGTIENLTVNLNKIRYSLLKLCLMIFYKKDKYHKSKTSYPNEIQFQNFIKIIYEGIFDRDTRSMKIKEVEKYIQIKIKKFKDEHIRQNINDLFLFYSSNNDDFFIKGILSPDKYLRNRNKKTFESLDSLFRQFKLESINKGTDSIDNDLLRNIKEIIINHHDYEIRKFLKKEGSVISKYPFVINELNNLIDRLEKIYKSDFNKSEKIQTLHLREYHARAKSLININNEYI